MRKIPKVLVDEMRREMKTNGVSREAQVSWFTWLRYYLDFCLKYKHSTRDPESSLLFIQKLASKGQSLEQQEQAGACIALFREVAKRFPAKGKEQDHSVELNDWGQVLVKIGIAIGIGIGIDIQTLHKNKISFFTTIPVLKPLFL